MPEKTPLTPITEPEAGEDQDRGLVDQVLAGKLDVFEELVRRHDRRIYRVTLAITQNKEDAEDSMQDAFLKALDHLDQFAGNARFSTWLTRIAVNEALQRLRKRGRFESLEEPIDLGENLVPQQVEDWRDNPEQQYAKEELRRLLEKVHRFTAPHLPHRFRFAGRRAPEQRRGRGHAESECAGHQVAPVAGPADDAGAAVPALRRRRFGRILMDCRQFLEEFSGFIDGESTIGIREAIEEHLAFCRKCEVIYNSTKRTLQIVTDCADQTYDIPSDVSARLHDRVRARLKEFEK